MNTTVPIMVIPENQKGIKNPKGKSMPPAKGPSNLPSPSKEVAVPIVMPWASFVSSETRAVNTGLDTADPNATTAIKV